MLQLSISQASEPAADAAEQHKRGVAERQTEFDREQRIRVVLFRGMPQNPFALRFVAERVEVPDHVVGLDSAKLTVSCVRGNHEIAGVRRKRLFLRQRADDIADGLFAHTRIYTMFPARRKAETWAFSSQSRESFRVFAQSYGIIATI